MYSIYAYFDISVGSSIRQLVYDPKRVSDGYVVTMAKFSNEKDKAGEASFTIPSSHPNYNNFKKIRTMILIMQDDNIVWYGRVYSIRRDFYFNKTIVCEGALTFLNDICLAPFRYYEKGTEENQDDYFLKKVTKREHIGYINDYYNYRCTLYRKVNINPNIAELSDSECICGTDSYNTVLQELLDKIIEDYNYSIICTYSLIQNESTEIPTDRVETNVNLVMLPTRNCGQKIEFGKNLIDFEEFISAEDLYNSIIPLGNGSLSIYDDNGLSPEESLIPLKMRDFYVSGGPESSCGPIDKVIEFNNIDDRDELISAAGKIFSLGGGSTTSKFTISAIDLHLLDVNTDAIRVGNSVRVISEPHNIDEDFVCSKAVVDILNPESSEYEFCKPILMSPETITGHFYDYEFRVTKKLNQRVQLNHNYGVLNINQNGVSLAMILPKGGKYST